MTNQVANDSLGGASGRPNLFTPIALGPYTLPNRIVMAPLTRNRAGAGNVPSDLAVEYYRQRASAGLIFTEATQVSPQGVGYPNTPGIHSAAQVDAWRRVTDAVHDEGGRIFLQLWHVGRISHPSLQPEGALPVAPSAIKPEGDAVTFEGMQPFVAPRALETVEIPGIVAQYRNAAAKALSAGFDGVEIHAANGYLLDQFLRDGSNRRTDAYGGPIENRFRILREVTQAVIDIWGQDRVGVRLSPLNRFNSMSDSQPEATFRYAARELGAMGLAFLHVVETTTLDGSDPRRVDRAQIAKDFGGVYIANGGYDKARASEAVANGGSDLIAFGKPYIANPDLVERFVKDAPLNTPDPATFYGGDHRGYTDYPSLGSAKSSDAA